MNGPKSTRRKKVFHGFGTSEQKDNTENMFPHDQLALEKLRQLADKYPSFRLKHLGNTHAKVLLKASEFEAVSRFHWLSFRGDPDNTCRDERGTLIRQPEHVQNKFDDLVQQFGNDS